MNVLGQITQLPYADGLSSNLILNNSFAHAYSQQQFIENNLVLNTLNETVKNSVVPILTNIDRSLTLLVSLLERNKDNRVNESLASDLHLETDSFNVSTNSTSFRNTSASSITSARVVGKDKLLNSLAHVPLESYLTMDRIDALNRIAKSRSNFAQLLIYEIFDAHERHGATIAGAHGYRKLETKKVDWVIKICFVKHPLKSNEDANEIWVKIRNVIDTKLRVNLKKLYK